MAAGVWLAQRCEDAPLFVGQVHVIEPWLTEDHLHSRVGVYEVDFSIIR